MASIDNKTLIVLGLVILSGGLLMPAETTDTDYGGYEATTTTEEVEIKTPTIVLGVGFTLAGIIAKQRTDEQTSQPPDK